jgi:hypothetical protein
MVRSRDKEARLRALIDEAGIPARPEPSGQKLSSVHGEELWTRQ